MPVSSVGRGKVLKGLLWVSLQSLGPGLPIGRTYLAMLVGELDGLQDTQGLINTAPDRKIIDGGVANDTLGINNEKSTEGYRVIVEDPVGMRHLLLNI